MSNPNEPDRAVVLAKLLAFAPLERDHAARLCGWRSHVFDATLKDAARRGLVTGRTTGRSWIRAKVNPFPGTRL